MCHEINASPIGEGGRGEDETRERTSCTTHVIKPPPTFPSIAADHWPSAATYPPGHKTQARHKARCVTNLLSSERSPDQSEAE